MKNNNIYALLISAGDYEDLGLKNLPTYRGDPVLFGTALTLGLKVPQDHIRIITGDERPGFVRAATLARAIGEMKAQLGDSDIFILYFSGHGKSEAAATALPPSENVSIVLSDGEIELQSVIDYMAHIPAGAKILILDCCYSGGFRGAGPKRLYFDSAISEFAGKGIAIIASSSADEMSRPGPGGEYSIFTIMLAHSMIEGHDPLQEKVSLADIYGSMMEMMGRWNAENPDRQQHPVFRSSVGGTIYFPLRESAVRVQEQRAGRAGESGARVQGNDDRARGRAVREGTVQGRAGRAGETTEWQPAPGSTAYSVHGFKPMDHAAEKRIAVFVVVDESIASPQSLSRITGEIVSRITSVAPADPDTAAHKTGSGTGIYSGRVSEQDVIWCYFGYDASDIRRGLFVAYTIWCRSDSLRAKYFCDNRNASVVEGIYLFRNNSYAILKDMQRPVKSREAVEADYKKLLALIVTEAERFIYDLQEVRNRTVSIEQMRGAYGEWIGRVKGLYIRLSEEEAAPDDLYDWAEAILDLAGWVADLAILFEGNRGGGTGLRANERWLIDYSIRRYYAAVEKLSL